MIPMFEMNNYILNWLINYPILQISLSLSKSQALLTPLKSQKDASGKKNWLQWRNGCRKWELFLEQLQIILQKMELEFTWTVLS